MYKSIYKKGKYKMKIKTKIFMIILSILLIGYDFNKKEEIDNNSVIDENNTLNVIQEESYAQEKINLEEFKENMGNDDYGIKKETLTISDTSAKGKGYYGNSLKINYPYIYTIEDDNIIYNSNTSLILNLVIEDLFSYYGVALNDIKNESAGKEIDYSIAYKDNNFLSLDYSFNWIERFTGFNYNNPDNMNSEFNDNIRSEVDRVSTTINLYFSSKFTDTKPIDLEPDIIKREDIISDEEIFEILDNKSYKLVDGVEEAFIPYDDGDKSSYYATDYFLLKDNNKLQVTISVPSGMGRFATIEIDYNWKEKLERKYINKP